MMISALLLQIRNSIMKRLISIFSTRALLLAAMLCLISATALAQHKPPFPEVMSRTWCGKAVTLPRTYQDERSVIYEAETTFVAHDTTFLYLEYAYWRCDTCSDYQLDSSAYFIRSRKEKEHWEQVEQVCARHYHVPIRNEYLVNEHKEAYKILKENHPNLVPQNLGKMPRIWYQIVKYNGAYYISIDAQSVLEFHDSILLRYGLECIYSPLYDFQELKDGGWSYTSTDYYDKWTYDTIIPCKQLKGAYILTTSDGKRQNKYLITDEKHVGLFDIIDWRSTDHIEIGLERYETIDFDALK